MSSTPTRRLAFQTSAREPREVKSQVQGTQQITVSSFRARHYAKNFLGINLFKETTMRDSIP